MPTPPPLTAAAGFDWGERLTHASDYFPQFHALAVELIKEGKAYVDESSVEELRRMRGSLTQPGENSPFRERSIADNLRLFEQMTAGELPDGAAVVRLKIDMAAGNMNLRDPPIYRIKRDADHPMTGRGITPSYLIHTSTSTSGMKWWYAPRARRHTALRAHAHVHTMAALCGTPACAHHRRHSVECLPDVRLRARAH